MSDQLEVNLYDADANLVASSANFIDTLKIGKFSTSHFFDPAANAQFWDPQNPYLYTLEITSTGRQAEVDVYRLFSVGIRTVSLQNNKLYLNNKQIYLHGVDKHEGLYLLLRYQ
jgi:beta-galactosidase/beta-glucuronidase